MNWSEIKEKYPKSYSRYDKQYRISSNSDIYGEHYPDSRVLYDFFDEQGIYIDVTVDLDGQFKCDILNSECDYIWCEKDNQNSRTEAEESAFLRAFEILENKLKVEQCEK